MWVIGHRGASAFAPENTLAAFRRAAEMGAAFIELDLQLSRDARLIVLHDDTLERTTNGHGPASGKTLNELCQLDAGAWFDAASFSGERIPTIEEVLAFGLEHDVGLYLEIKVNGLAGAEQALIGALRDSSAIDRSVVISFDTGTLERVRRLEPLVVTGFLYEESLADPVGRTRQIGARQLLPRLDLITPDLVSEARRNDLKVVAWTADTPEAMKALITLGVDGIITNDPRTLVSMLAQRGRELPKDLFLRKPFP